MSLPCSFAGSEAQQERQLRGDFRRATRVERQLRPIAAPWGNVCWDGDGRGGRWPKVGHHEKLDKNSMFAEYPCDLFFKKH